MSRHAFVGILVVCFVSIFMTMLYQYGSNSWKLEASPPQSGHGSHHAAPGGHGATPQVQETPGGAVMTPMAHP